MFDGRPKLLETTACTGGAAHVDNGRAGQGIAVSVFVSNGSRKAGIFGRIDRLIYGSIVLCIILIGGRPSFAQTGTTGSKFFKVYDASPPGDQLVLKSIAHGIFEGIAYADALKPGKPLYCMPPNLNLGSEQLVSMMRDELAERPNMGELPYAVLVLGALQHTFPCSRR